jgi:hypothetical protein
MTELGRSCLGGWAADTQLNRGPAHFDSQHPDLAAYLRDAMAAYAQVRLS